MTVLTDNLLDFFEKTQKLKSTLRHSWTSDKNRQESTAEHTWHLTLMAMTLAPYLRSKINILRVLKMLTVHDLAEAETGDIPAFMKAKNKHHQEEVALKRICKNLSPRSRKEILNLWQEFEERKTKDAIFAKMLDVLDVLNQHLIADISTWAPIEFEFNLNRASEEYFLKEPLLLNIYDTLVKRLEKKVKDSTLKIQKALQKT